MRRIAGRGRPVASAALAPGRPHPAILLTVEGEPLAEAQSPVGARGAELTRTGCEIVREPTLKRAATNPKTGEANPKAGKANPKSG